MAVSPFQINIPDSELDLLHRKLELARIPDLSAENCEENGVTPKLIRDTVDYWLKSYDWRAEEAKLNELPQFTTPIEVDDGFGTLDVHFVHSISTKADSIPLLFIHGWPGSFMEVIKGLPLLNKAGFHVIAPSLPGYGFSSYTTKRGFDLRRHAEVMHKLMHKLGYEHFVVQGGDWGSSVAHALALHYPQSVKAIHRNMLHLPKQTFAAGQEPKYTPFEQHSLERYYDWFLKTNSAYSALQGTKPLTLGIAMHDSPVAMLTWMCDKLFLWSDNYPWTPTELITWTLLNYLPGPTTGFIMYYENNPPAAMVKGTWADRYVEVPSGFSAFPQEILMVPRSWAERVANVQFWREHEKGGHFAMYERPEELVADLVEFYNMVWEG